MGRLTFPLSLKVSKLISYTQTLGEKYRPETIFTPYDHKFERRFIKFHRKSSPNVAFKVFADEIDDYDVVIDVLVNNESIQTRMKGNWQLFDDTFICPSNGYHTISIHGGQGVRRFTLEEFCRAYADIRERYECRNPTDTFEIHA